MLPRFSLLGPPFVFLTQSVPGPKTLYTKTGEHVVAASCWHLWTLRGSERKRGKAQVFQQPFASLLAIDSVLFGNPSVSALKKHTIPSFVGGVLTCRKATADSSSQPRLKAFRGAL